MTRNFLGIFIIALVTLMNELTLTRVFDAALGENLAYMVITCAIFAFGLAGIVITLRPVSPLTDVGRTLSRLSFCFAASILLVPMVMHIFPAEFWQFHEASFRTAFSFGIVYLGLMVPFFFSGLIITLLISTYSESIRRLYFWDLVGAGIGSIILIPLLPKVGPGGIFVIASGVTLVAAWLFHAPRPLSFAKVIGGVGILVIPFLVPGALFTFTDTTLERYEKQDREQLVANLELSVWDPISKVDILNLRDGSMKGISLDGGSQHSAFVKFDGNVQKLRTNLALLKDHLFHLGVVAAHFLKRDSHSRVLIIGSAGGQEIKAALMYNPEHVDAVDLVETVVNLGKTTYRDYIGNIFNHPNVNVEVGEGRNFLRSTDTTYDIIQIHSNHTTSSIASGTGAMVTGYLYTVEAFQLYFEKLTDNGILEINMFLYPRLVTAGAEAWKRMGRRDFQKHVVVVELGGGRDWLPTLLVKAQPWTTEELNELKKVFFEFPNWHGKKFTIAENPLSPENNFLDPIFYSGHIPEALAQRVDYRIRPATDDRPFFIFIRNKLGPVVADDEKFMNQATAELLNRQLFGSVLTMDIFHFVIVGVASLFYAVLFILVPLWCSRVGRGTWPGKALSLSYFACLGAGFIIFELVLIQMFMHFIGFPLYTLSVTIFSLLLGAGVGSLASISLNVSPTTKWALPFLGILITGGLFFIFHPSIFNLFQGAPTWARVFVAAVLITPFGFFLGMPFPLGIAAVTNMARMAIPWAWGINGLFTAIGGLSCVLLSLFYGFRMTFLIGLGIYLFAFLLFWKIRERIPPFETDPST